MKTFRHFQFDNDGITVRHISELSSIIENNPLVLYFPETPENAHITFGWRRIDGKWYEPLQIPEQEPTPIKYQPTNAEVLQAVNAIYAELQIKGVV